MMPSSIYEFFFELLKAGLWGIHPRLSSFENVDLKEIFSISQEHSVVGLVTAGLDRYVEDGGELRGDTFLFMHHVLAMEKRNISMNKYIGRLFTAMSKEEIFPVLVKGQGIAQCYDKPLWRDSGDIDLLVDTCYYRKAKEFMSRIAECNTKEKRKHNEMMHSEFFHCGWLVEIHGSLHATLSSRMDSTIDSIQSYMFRERLFREWKNENTSICLPLPNDDVIFVFSHILQHLFGGGVGLRQICDLCRLLWTYKTQIDRIQLSTRLKKMGIMSEWQVFANMMVTFLGFPENDMPYYDASYCLKGQKMMSFILESGNFGHSRNYTDLKNYHTIIRKVVICKRRYKDALILSTIFPFDALIFFSRFLWHGIKDTIFKG